MKKLFINCSTKINSYIHWRRSLVLQILIVFILFNIISILLFTFYIIKNDEIISKKNAEDSLQIIAQEKAQLISYMMNQVENEAKNIAEWATEYIILADGTMDLPDHYDFTENGVLFRKIDSNINYNTFINSTTNIYFPSNRDINEGVKRK